MIKKSTKNRYYDKQGKNLPGVTSILAVMAKPALLNWCWECGIKGIDFRKVRDTRAGIGTLVHNMIECELTNTQMDAKSLAKYSPEDMQIALKCKKGWDDWKAKQKDFEVLDVELVMSSDTLGFGGTCDVYYKSNGKYVLMDFKTSKACYDEHKIQQTAYKLLLEEQNKQVDEIKLFQLNENKTGVIPVAKNLIPLYTKIFLACLELYKALRALDIVKDKVVKKTSKFKKKVAEL